jgi:hypothetical protein
MKRINEKFNQSNLTGRFFLLAIFSFIFAGSASATAPANDNFANAEVINGIQVHITRSNAGATKETGEPDHAGNAGGKSVWFKWTAPMSRMMNFSTNRTAGNLDTLLQVYTGTALNNLAYESGSNNIHDDFNLRSNTSFIAYQGTTYFIAVDGAQVNGQTAEGAFQLDISPTFRSQGADYDNDGQANIAVFRPSAGTFFHLNNSSQQTVYTLWGANGDVPVAGGENGGNYFLVFRPSNGTWYMKYSACCASEFSIKWGTTGDIPVPEAYGADTSDPAVFRPSDGTWYLYNFQGDHRYYRFGLAGDIPVPGQYTPDGFAEIAVFRPSNGVWYFIKRVSNNDFEDSFAAVQFGQAGDKPVPGDYDGDGLLDIAVYRPSTGTWWVLRSSDGQAQTFKWGIAEDLPTTGDFDGDGKFDFAVFRPSNNQWYIYRSGDGSIFIKEFGLAGDIPVTANRTF